MSIEVMAMSAAVAALLKSLTPVLEQYRRRHGSAEVVVKRGEVRLDALENLSSEQLAKLIELVKESGPNDVGTFALSREAAAQTTTSAEATTAPQAAGVALAFGKDAVFRDARRRVELVFKINLGVAIVLAIILLMGIGGAVFSAVFLQQTIWAATFGGVATADLIGLYVFKPLTAINSAIVASQRLDAVHLRLSEQLHACSQHESLKERIDCQTAVWDTIQRELASLAG